MLEFTVWDVSHGSATYIKTPNNRHFVVDLGDDGDSFSPLNALYSRGLRTLDAVIITHPHRDHLDDIFNFSLLSPQTFWRPRHLHESEIRNGNRASDIAIIDEYLAVDKRYMSALTPTTDITAPLAFGGAEFHIFAPRFCDRSNLNNHSLVVVASYAGLKMLIPGDNESPSWNELLADPTFVTAAKGTDVMLAAHHGRDAGFCNDLFTAIGKPKLVVISDGRFRDTSATDRYSNQATGWTVFDGVGKSETRYCVTTRADGHITVQFDYVTNNPLYRNSLSVTTSKPSLFSFAQLTS